MAWLDAQASILFTLFYVLFGFCFVFQSKEFASAGLSPENILCLLGWLGHRQGEDGSGSEELQFLNYHILKVSGILENNSISSITDFFSLFNLIIKDFFSDCRYFYPPRIDAVNLSCWVFLFCIYGRQ